MFNQNGAEMWRKMLTENFNVTDSEKLNWVSEYASVHEIHESALGVNAAVPGGVLTAPVAPLYANPMNTTGMGNPYAPGKMPTDSTAPAAKGNLWNQTPGSGDIPVSTLPMALNVALLTIGLELVPVVPAKGPWAMLTYMDFPYAGGKLGRVNETSFDGKGEGTENKPIYVKATGLSLATIAELRKAVALVEGVDVKVGKFEGKFLGFGRMDGAPMFKVVTCGDANTSLKEAFAAAVNFEVAGAKLLAEDLTAGTIVADFVQTSVDLVDGFANFATGKKEAMTRAQNETGTGNVIGLRLFSKWIQMGSYEVTGTVTRQQLQDLPLYGVDAVGKVMEALQNEITQHINARLLERVFALGLTNAAKLKAAQGVDLNLYIGAASASAVTLSEMATGTATFTDIYGANHANTTVEPVEGGAGFENTSTRQRRLSSRILAAANLIQTVGRRGRATWVVVNAQIASALQDCSGYVVAPMVNNMAQDGSQNLFLGGTLAGLKVYVDPYMSWDDTRVCVGRKGDANSPGVIFMPYILADTVSITAEGTMAPKMLVNSRYAIAEAGFFPEAMYYTFAVRNDFGWV